MTPTSTIHAQPRTAHVAPTFRPALSLVLLFLAACAGQQQIRHDPLPAQSLAAARTSIAVPDNSTGVDACLAAAEGAAREALVLWCMGTGADAGQVALERLARAAYDPKTEQFRAVDMAPNIRVVPMLAGDGRYRFAADYRLGAQRAAGTFAGAGVPLVYVRETTDEGLDLHYPPEGYYEPVTLTAEAVRVGDGLEIHLLPVSGAALHTGGWAEAPAQAYLQLMTTARLKDDSWLGFVNAARMVSHPSGIYMLEPYDSERIPLLLIHGLKSSPLIWRDLTVAVMSDRDLHRRFQVWHAFYPTGVPPFFTTARLRATLHQLLDELDAEGDDMARRHMALVGHSMGGIITRGLVTDDHGVLWDTTFTVPPEDLAAPADKRAELESILNLRHEPQIGFAAFINTPHRGSRTARGVIGHVASALVNLPSSFQELFGSDPAYRAQTTDAMRPYITGKGPNAVRVLRPEHPLLRALADMPIAEGVTVVSVVGVKKGPACVQTPGCNATDGVVEYSSAHLAEGRELVVQSGHDSYRHPDALKLITEALKGWRPAAMSAAHQE